MGKGHKYAFQMTHTFYMETSQGLLIVLDVYQLLLESFIFEPVDPLPLHSVLVKVV